jgi:hypothetical protein
MTEKNNLPKQLPLPFLEEDSKEKSATVFSLVDHLNRVREQKPPTPPAEVEKRILDRIIEQANQLSWYK